MKRDIELDQLSAAEHTDSVAQWRARGEVDGARHYPKTDRDVRDLAEQMRQEAVEPEQQSGAGELQSSLAQQLATNGVETLSTEDVHSAVVSKAADGAAEMAAVVPVARAAIVQARQAAREEMEQLTAFRTLHEPVLQGRAPLPEPGKWKRLSTGRHVLFVALIFVLEAGGFLLLGHEYWREAALFGVFGGAISGFFLWSIHHVLTNGQTRFALGRTRVWLVATLVVLGHLVSAYVMACVRDRLHEINYLQVSKGIGELLVVPWALSPESMLVVVLGAVLLLATWLMSVGRSPFPFEDEYRRLWARWKLAEAAVDEAKRKPFADVTRIAERSRQQLDELQELREEAHRHCRGIFGQAERAMRSYLVHVNQARSTATRCWEAYAAANRQARAAGNPPPRSLNAPLPIAATLEFDRDLLASFKSQLQHALDLAGHSQKATTQAQRVLSVYTADLLAHLERVVEDPGLVEPPPSFEMVLQEAQGAAFKSAGEPRHAGSDEMRRFLGL